jgi:hypothetical protein
MGWLHKFNLKNLYFVLPLLDQTIKSFNNSLNFFDCGVDRGLE